MSYSNISAHHSMVFDDVRNELYARAIRAAVKPDSVVLDLGAGIGILGLIAAAQGAKRVYLVEPESVVQQARDIATANGVAERIVVLEGKIEEIELPEKVDVILSVCTGNLLYSEDLLPLLFLARDRFLKPGGRMIPDLAELVLAPIADKELHDTHVGRWSLPTQGLDFSPSRRFAANEIIWLSGYDKQLEQLAGGVAVTSVDLMQAVDGHCNGQVSCTVAKAGACTGLLGWIRIRLGEHWLSTAPDAPEVHWSRVVLPLDPPLYLEAGEMLTIKLQRPAHGDWTWMLQAASGTRRHSSFLARTDGLRRLQKFAPDYTASLSAKGTAALHILALIQAGTSNADIAAALVELDPVRFPDTGEGLKTVQAMVLQYAKNAQ